jgi:hypothetical protein
MVISSGGERVIARCSMKCTRGKRQRGMGFLCGLSLGCKETMGIRSPAHGLDELEFDGDRIRAMRWMTQIKIDLLQY